MAPRVGLRGRHRCAKPTLQVHLREAGAPRPRPSSSSIGLGRRRRNTSYALSLRATLGGRCDREAGGRGQRENHLAIENSLAKPLREFRFTARAGSDRLARLHDICRIEAQAISVVGQKQPGNHPAGTFVPVGKSIISDQPKGISSRQCCCVRGLVSC
jgi:hypothetical protein